jgi:exodeoxyribonuclease VII small subunit
MNIEEGLEELEKITARLENEEVPLDEAIALFEQGLTLAASIKEQLEAARLRIEQVLEKTKGTFALEPFDLS